MYQQSISRRHRTAFLIAIDQSGSMEEQCTFLHRRMSKAEAVAEVTDGLIYELIERARRSDGVRDYYDIALLSYSGEGVRPLIGDRFFHTVTELAAVKTVPRTIAVERILPDGSAALHTLEIPGYIRPFFSGQTPMFDTLKEVKLLAEEWCRRPEHAESFPPTVFNITDGEASDCDPIELQEVSDDIRALKTFDGNVLLMNIHIATDGSKQPLLFPTSDEIDPKDRYARQLFDSSSVMPDIFVPSILEMRRKPGRPPYRAMGYNVTASQVAALLNIGSVSVPIQ